MPTLLQLFILPTVAAGDSMRRLAACLLATAIAAATGSAWAQTSPMTPDITGKPFVAADASNDYIKREVMIPMRDGVKLHTVI
ncbi:glutaryl-7-ACA acylase, partial [Xanthomonas perforans]|nr:glutaryl-7-ACA acylase [Xanthomonas perforans]